MHADRAAASSRFEKTPDFFRTAEWMMAAFRMAGGPHALEMAGQGHHNFLMARHGQNTVIKRPMRPPRVLPRLPES